jgi:hypothetical protein
VVELLELGGEFVFEWGAYLTGRCVAFLYQLFRSIIGAVLCNDPKYQFSNDPIFSEGGYTALGIVTWVVIGLGFYAWNRWFREVGN